MQAYNMLLMKFHSITDKQVQQ